MTDVLRLEASSTALVVIDIQERLASAMKSKVLEEVVRSTGILVEGMTALGSKTLVTEQYPKGLGNTVPELQSRLEGVTPVEKVEFDCCAADGFLAQLPEGTKSVVLTGMEAHICVLQTAAGFLERDLDVWVAQDAICSRSKENWKSSLRLMADAGAKVAPTETILFRMLGRAGGDAFKTISKLVR